MKKVRKNGLSGATAIVTPLIFLMSLATRRFRTGIFTYYLFALHFSLKNEDFEVISNSEKVRG